MANWGNLAAELNVIKGKRNAAPGYKKTISLTATADVASIESLIKEINNNDSVSYDLYGLTTGMPEDDYYSTVSTKIKFLRKKQITGKWCDTHKTCNPHTVKTCNPHTLTCNCNTQCGDRCSCDIDKKKTSNYSCSCQSQTRYSYKCTCNSNVSCTEREEYCSCEGVSNSYCSCNTVPTCSTNSDWTCCDGHGCNCVSVCSSNTPCSHCSSYTACPANCACYNVCTCVFV